VLSHLSHGVRAGGYMVMGVTVWTGKYVWVRFGAGTVNVGNCLTKTKCSC